MSRPCLCDVCGREITGRSEGFVTLVHRGTDPCDRVNVVHEGCGPEGYSISFVQLAEEGLPFWLDQLSNKAWITGAALETVRRAHAELPPN